MNMGSKIRDLRKEKRLSQTELGKLIHVSQQTVTAWENNKAEPTSSAVVQLAEVFNVSTDYLLGRPEKHKEDNSGLSENQKLVAYSIDPDISDEERKAIIEMVEAAKKFRRRI
ncbi:helix-turn-helix domain-containing protein [Limosilactobacillus ingluviei]|uniref:helix-turn-helix domain-containing protein n=1 Tax=Limosilactobacillus ingluviei TaxID=148604 RepID=UPI000592D0B4|nr:helix-turn-helix transcriptional regulator [Limosilactobacillus ingluviei]